MIQVVSLMTTYSTKDAAKLAGISWITLRRWLAASKVRPSVTIPTEGRNFYRWTRADVSKLRTFKRQHFGKGKGRKPQKGR